MPGGAPVGSLVDATLRARPPQVADGRHVGDIRVARVHADSGDVPGFLEAHVGPRAPAVHGLEDTIPPRRALAVLRLPRSHPHHVRVRRGEGDVPDGSRGLVGEEGGPRGAVVGALPYAGRGCAHVDDARVRLVYGEVADAPADDGGTDLAPLQEAGEGHRVTGSAGLSVDRCPEGQEGGAREDPGRESGVGAGNLHGSLHLDIGVSLF